MTREANVVKRALRPGQRVKISQEGLRSGISQPRCESRTGTVLPHRDYYPNIVHDVVRVLWDGYATTVSYHPDFVRRLHVRSQPRSMSVAARKRLERGL